MRQVKIHNATLAQRIAGAAQSINFLLEYDPDNTYISHHREKIEEYTKLLPHGSGIDGEQSIVIEESGFERIVIASSFHEMDDVGSYAGWTDYRIIVEPTFFGLCIDVEIELDGKEYDSDMMLSDYLSDVYFDALNQECQVVVK